MCGRAQGTILPGVTRRSLIELARARGFAVDEVAVPVADAMEADEIFTSGTAVVVSAVGSMTYQVGFHYSCPVRGTLWLRRCRPMRAHTLGVSMSVSADGRMNFRVFGCNLVQDLAWHGIIASMQAFQSLLYVLRTHLDKGDVFVVVYRRGGAACEKLQSYLFNLVACFILHDSLFKV